MDTITADAGAVTAPNQFVETRGRRLAYRSIGTGKPFVLCTNTAIPLLHVGGDHDISFPVENWYALNQQLPTLQLLTFPRSGHAPHHQQQEEVGEHIATFVRTCLLREA